MEKSEIERINKWINSKPKWFLYGANILSSKNSLEKTDIDTICDICLEKKEVDVQPFNVELLLGNSTQQTLSLLSISEINNVNGLAPRKPLVFTEHNMSIVYGTNGTGKSSYIRLLKNICNARQKENIESNVYTGDTSEQSAKIEYSIDGIPQPLYEWKKGDFSDDLKYCDIFDTKYCDLFLKKADTVTYEPPVLSFFTKLADMAERVSDRIDSLINSNPSKLPVFPNTLLSTNASDWFTHITYKTKHNDIDTFCIFTDEDSKELLKIQNRLVETNQLEKSQKLQKQADKIQNLINYINNYYDLLSSEKYEELKKLRIEYENKKEIQINAAENAFGNSSLNGVGSDTWKALWTAAKKYSEEKAYTGMKFPYLEENVSRCVLCHQVLKPEALQRLRSFDEFVKGELEQDVKDAEDNIKIYIEKIQAPKTSQDFEARIDAYDDFFTSTLKDELCKINNNLLQTYDSFVNNKSYVKLIQKDKAISELENISKQILANVEQLKNDYEKIDIKTLTAQKHELEAKKWLYDNKNAIISEVQRRKNIQFLNDKKFETNTKQISLEKGRLSELLITEEFVNRFQNEIKKLDVNVDVTFEKDSLSKAHVYHRIVLKNIKKTITPDKVLSEGEYRIVSIAAFLADMLGRNDNVPFIFDDPISSLDQDYEESVARRLVELSTTRQVIVFTHRLSFMCCLQDEADHQETVSPKVISIKKEYWGAGEPSDLPINCDKPDKKLKNMLNTDVPKIEKKLQEVGIDETANDIKSLCSNFRIVIERTVETYLICGVVERFRRSVQTMNRIKKLSNISEQDCNLIDDLMTEYSKYEHSQSYEMPGKLPNIEKIKQDMNKLNAWITEYKKRTDLK